MVQLPIWSLTLPKFLNLELLISILRNLYPTILSEMRLPWTLTLVHPRIGGLGGLLSRLILSKHPLSSEEPNKLKLAPKSHSF